MRKVNAAGIISSAAGNGTGGDTGDGGPATDAALSPVGGVATDHAGNLYIATTNRVRKVDTAGVITAFAGSPASGFSGDGGPATAALFSLISGLTIDTADNIYLGDAHNYRVRKISPAGIVSTIAGNGVSGFSGDGGPATNASLGNAMTDISVDEEGNIYIADLRNFRIRKVNPAGIITTIAGNGIQAYAGDGGPAIAASLFTPSFVTRSSKGNIYISDRNINRIRVITMPQIAIAASRLSHTVCAGITDTFSATVTNDAIPPIYQWLLNGAAIGTNSPLYITDTLHNGDVVSCVLKYVSGDTQLTQSNSIIITVDSFPPHAGTLSGADTVCKGDTIALAHTAAGGAWSSTNALAAVAAGMVTGLRPGRDTIRYIVTNGCGADTASHAVAINDCKLATNILAAQQQCLQVLPNPNNGSFAVTLTAANPEPVAIKITDVLGHTIQQLAATTNQPVNIQLSAPPGVYFITATTAHGVWSSKVIVR